MKSALFVTALLVAGHLFAQPAPKKENPAVAKAKAEFEAAKTAAEGGDPLKLIALADLYYAGKGTTRSYPEAYKAYLAAAEKGNVLAESTVGWLLRQGQGATRDYKKSMEWFTKAAEKGHVESQMGLAEIYYNSVGLPKRDFATAYKWYLIAAGLGSKDAKAFIPRMAATVLRDPHVTAEQKTAAEKAAKDWLTAYAAKTK